MPRLLLCLFLLPALALGTEFTVSPEGDDANAGTRGRPFRTLERARDAVRTAKDGGATVWLRGGVYPRESSFVLSGKQDSGTQDAPIVWRGVEGEDVRLVGGRVIPTAALKPVTDKALLNRIDAAARAHVVAADLKALGVQDFGALSRGAFNGGAMLEVFFNGKAMPLARWPNGRGWAKYG
ncbi:hypothetical protein HQ560_21250, partial [bacterium]|nr:hypothetical protein [bacterium]